MPILSFLGVYTVFREEQREKTETVEFELVEEKSKNKTLGAQIADFTRYEPDIE